MENKSKQASTINTHYTERASDGNRQSINLLTGYPNFHDFIFRIFLEETRSIKKQK